MDGLFHPFASDTSILAGIGYALFGMAIVFLMLWILMLVIGAAGRGARQRRPGPAAGCAGPDGGDAHGHCGRRDGQAAQ